MAEILYLEPVGGISGDMTVAALIDLGVPLELLREGLAKLGLDSVEIATAREERHHLSGTRFIVTDRGASDSTAAPKAHRHPPAEDGGHFHPNSHGETHSHPHRAYRDIRKMIEGSALAEGAREIALAIFAKLAEAEGAVHGLPAGEVTFHEVGAWDSIADVVSTALALDHLLPDAVYCAPVPVGGGTVHTAHGVMPVPAPATLLLLKGFPVVYGGPAFERTTPTGAAILAATATPAPEPFSYIPEKVGLGIGARDDPEVPNILRAVMGRTVTDGTGGSGLETIECAEANLDDANPEWIGYLMERLLEAGALDVCLIPVQMKKNRPGTLIQTLYPPHLRDSVTALLFSEVTTLGVRFRTLERMVLARESARVRTPWGEVEGKVSHHEGKSRFSPEFESCRKLARERNIPLRDVYLEATRAWGGEQEGG
ncbi:MAG: nickel pincer cofactor biosynthesis protein LarC [bacterium]